MRLPSRPGFLRRGGASSAAEPTASPAATPNGSDGSRSESVGTQGGSGPASGGEPGSGADGAAGSIETNGSTALARNADPEATQGFSFDDLEALSEHLDRAAARVPAGANGPELVRPLTRPELVAAAVERWRKELVAEGGASALADLAQLGDARLDITQAHPSGTAQLFAGRPTRLSSLIREPARLTTARRRARNVSVSSAELSQRYGVAPAYLAVGIARWDGSAKIPVLLRPVVIEPRGAAESDYELTLEDRVEINPVLLRALRSSGALVDASALARDTFTGSGFAPLGVLNHLQSLGRAVLDGFQIEESLLVGPFVHPGQSLVDDLDATAQIIEHHEVIAAIAGSDEAIAELATTFPAPLRGDLTPESEAAIGDLTPDQRGIFEAAMSGRHMMIEAPPGADVSGTVAAIAAGMVRQGKTVHYVPANRRSADGVARVLANAGLSEILLDTYPDPTRGEIVIPSLLAGLTAAGGPTSGELANQLAAVDPPTAALRQELVSVRGQLAGYVDALHVRREPWGVSAHEALQSLASLTSTRPTPRTTARLSSEIVRSMTPERREDLRAELMRAARLGAFDVGPGDTPWFGADIVTSDAARETLALIDELLTNSLPALAARIDDVANRTGIDRAMTMTQWGEQLTMLSGVRSVLDVFQPIAFERSAADMIAATATKEWRVEHGVDMKGSTRRRLCKQAADLVRPGRPCPDLHAGLVQVQRQRDEWRKHCPSGGWPQLPADLAPAEAQFAEVKAQLRALGEVLAETADGGEFLDVPLTEVVARIERLKRDAAALTTLPERTAAMRLLRGAGLEPLLLDLATRRVPEKLVGKELDLAWWSSVFESIIREEPALFGYDGDMLSALADRFRELDLAHLATLGRPVLASAIMHRDHAVHANRPQAEAFFAELLDGRLPGLREVSVRYPDVAPRVRPVWLVSPLLIPRTTPVGRAVDLVIIDAGQEMTTAQAIAALSRGRQVIVIGDPQRASSGLVHDLNGILPSLPILTDTARRDPRMTQFFADCGYGRSVRPVPLPDSEGLLRFEVVADGAGMPAPGHEEVESVPQEIERVVDLVLEHAVTHPEESLAVVTITKRHAAALRDAIVTEVHRNPSLSTFFAVDREEPFVVTDARSTSGLSRDAVIVSIGFGKTPHGRVLHRFGPISEAGGNGVLLDALAVSRHRLTVVSCFTSDDLNRERLRTPGPRMLDELLRFMADASSGANVPELTLPDPLLVDLAERVWRMGLDVIPNVGTPGGIRIPLAVGHPDIPDRMLVAVLTDDAEYVAEPSVRVRDRLALSQLTDRGWTVLHVWTAAAFMDPQAEAARILAATTFARDAILGDRPKPVAARVELPTHVDEDFSEKATAVLTVPEVEGSGVGEHGEASPVTATDVKAGGLAESGAKSSAEDQATEDKATEDRAKTGTATGDATDGDARPDAIANSQTDADADGANEVGDIAGANATTGVATDLGAPSTLAKEPVNPWANASAKAAERDSYEDSLSVTMTGSLQPPSWDEIVGWAADELPAPGEQDTSGDGSGSSSADSRGPRPLITGGLPISAYSDDQLDDLVSWISSDGTRRSEAEMCAEVRRELGVERRNARVDSVIAIAVRRRGQ